jgi:hypothetical protein
MYTLDNYKDKVFDIDTETFASKYRYIENYDDYVENIETQIVYKATFKGFAVELVEVSNIQAIKTFEKNFAKVRADIEKRLAL